MSNTKKQLVFVGLSGGVDSSVAAGLLKKEGYTVIGVFMKCWEGEDDKIGCGWEQDEEDARQVASKLEIPFYSWDFTKEYKERVMQYFLEGYQKGITPNPDIECNREIKFGLFLKRSLKMGADFVATGHYARKDKAKDIFQLKKGIDNNKDQSYFLWTLNQKQLQRTLFPIGEYIKTDVRALAQKWELPNFAKPDSQGVCFVGRIDVRDFLKGHLELKPGKIKTTDGEIIGEHEGLPLYTIGQRRGIKIGGGIPYFVVQRDFSKNELIVAKGRRNTALFKQELIAKDLNWISGKTPHFPLDCQAKIRYRQADQICQIFQKSKASLRVKFKEPQRAVTLGQSIVFYDQDKVLGGGIIQ